MITYWVISAAASTLPFGTKAFDSEGISDNAPERG